jgi:hypothetical protein
MTVATETNDGELDELSTRSGVNLVLLEHAVLAQGLMWLAEMLEAKMQQQGLDATDLRQRIGVLMRETRANMEIGLVEMLAAAESDPETVEELLDHAEQEHTALKARDAEDGAASRELVNALRVRVLAGGDA